MNGAWLRSVELRIWYAAVIDGKRIVLQHRWHALHGVEQRHHRCGWCNHQCISSVGFWLFPAVVGTCEPVVHGDVLLGLLAPHPSVRIFLGRHLHAVCAAVVKHLRLWIFPKFGKLYVPEVEAFVQSHKNVANGRVSCAQDLPPKQQDVQRSVVDRPALALDAAFVCQVNKKRRMHHDINVHCKLSSCRACRDPKPREDGSGGDSGKQRGVAGSPFLLRVRCDQGSTCDAWRPAAKQ
mmetsp:Transcript_25803/g.35511  ORF Transcript_25803/g.35511 Transcript_25803/m.35511 type:complete len:237 (-) Transcript_25803:57-767(-)